MSMLPGTRIFSYWAVVAAVEHIATAARRGDPLQEEETPPLRQGHPGGRLVCQVCTRSNPVAWDLARL